MAVAPGELLARNAFHLERDEQFTLLRREPSGALAIVQELVEKNVGVEGLRPLRVAGAPDLHPDPVAGWCNPQFMHRPSEREAAQLSCDGKGDVRMPGLEFSGTQEFEQGSYGVLSDIVARERREGRGDLALGAMNGRNEGQKENLPADRRVTRFAAEAQQFQKCEISLGAVI
jgi:hypothetical protein